MVGQKSKETRGDSSNYVGMKAVTYILIDMRLKTPKKLPYKQ